ncbi:protein Dok-7 isoform X4 [Cavia porcellus]|uniref:protein Dok-7 isoform X4 n=1 Tax=Cavia porcellus TaxID=10141 RepID=UPI000661DAE9|nr:protein Dok-7 isoform X4 [Cavia porcellus]
MGARVCFRDHRPVCTPGAPGPPIPSPGLRTACSPTPAVFPGNGLLSWPLLDVPPAPHPGGPALPLSHWFLVLVCPTISRSKSICGTSWAGHHRDRGRGHDCLLMLAYKDRSERTRGLRERSNLTLADICGLEPGLPYEGLAHTLAIVCLSQTVMLGFDSRETMCAWDARIRYALGEVHGFHVTVAPGTKLESGPATLHLCNDTLVLAKDVPPAVMGQWKLSDLRRYGAVPSGFIFEGGTRCGYWAGVFFLSSAKGEQISFLIDCVVRGVSPTRGPFGLQPVLPDPSPGGNLAMEERLAQEALEALQLEKRLSTLSHAGRSGSGGDDRSLSSSSSEASHSDISTSGRLATWPEQFSSLASISQEGLGLAAAQVPGEAVLSTSRPPPKPLRPRQLQEVGRQSSSDSGIATGSHSSYSGSFSSYSGSSLDVWWAGEDFGSLLSLPLPGAGAPEPSLCTCPPGAAEYQVPTSQRPHYDTPRSLRPAPGDQSPASRGGPDQGAAVELGSQISGACPSGWLGTKRQGQVTEAPGSEATQASPASVEPWEASSPHAGPTLAFFSACPLCGGLKGVAASPPGLISAQSAPPPGSSCTTRGCSSSRAELASELPTGAGASHYTQIDITATEAAQQAGAQHAWERLSELQQHRRGALQ